MIPDAVHYVLAAVILLIVFYIWRQHKTRSAVPLPPGPPRLPIIGNIHNKPAKFEWEAYANWGQKYGSEVIYLNMAGTHIVVLNTRKAASDLLEKRGSIYSSRAHSTMVHDLIGFTWLFAVMPNDDGWRIRRRLLQRYFKFPIEDSHAIANVNLTWQRPHQTKYINKLLEKLVERPDHFMKHLIHMVGSVSLSTTFGLAIKPEDDPYIKLSCIGAEGLKQATVPGAFLVDVFPFMKQFPRWCSFLKKARLWHEDMRAMLEIPFEDAKKQWQNQGKIGGNQGSALVSFVSEALDDIYSSDAPDLQQEEFIKEVCATIFMGTIGTTSGVMHVFMLAMVHNLEVQKRAQVELDSVLRGPDGKLRLPTHDDEPMLPYCTAVVKETLRWSPIAPICIPHMSTEEDVYEGYQIPKGAVVIPNAWAMLHDPEMYQDPSAFIPERFLHKDGTLDTELAKDVELGFGFGRRICPGRHLGSSIVWLAAVSILTTCKILKAKDEDGNIIEPGMELESAITADPKPFKCNIKPRSAETAELIKQVAMDADYISP
ncbi:hypothetical protein Ac2012v2_007100 [Leucoagaricus gongylophorus]